MYGGSSNPLSMKGGKALSGGMVQSVTGTQVVAVILALAVAHTVLAILMWSNVIEFATNDTKIAVATTITVIAALLLAYLIFLVTSDSY